LQGFAAVGRGYASATGVCMGYACFSV